MRHQENKIPQGSGNISSALCNPATKQDVSLWIDVCFQLRDQSPRWADYTCARKSGLVLFWFSHGFLLLLVEMGVVRIAVVVIHSGDRLRACVCVVHVRKGIAHVAFEDVGLIQWLAALWGPLGPLAEFLYGTVGR